MKSHNGMRPQDIVILLKIITVDNIKWQYRDLASSLSISISEISESLIRSHLAGLVDESRRIVHRQSLLEFIEHGLKYVFPQAPGTLVTGIPTAHSHIFFEKSLVQICHLYGRMITALLEVLQLRRFIRELLKQFVEMSIYISFWHV